MIAAVVPAFLFYIALLFQADMYAVSHGLKGHPPRKSRTCGRPSSPAGISCFCWCC